MAAKAMGLRVLLPYAQKEATQSKSVYLPSSSFHRRSPCVEAGPLSDPGAPRDQAADINLPDSRRRKSTRLDCVVAAIEPVRSTTGREAKHSSK